MKKYLKYIIVLAVFLAAGCAVLRAAPYIRHLQPDSPKITPTRIK